MGDILDWHMRMREKIRDWAVQRQEIYRGLPPPTTREGLQQWRKRAEEMVAKEAATYSKREFMVLTGLEYVMVFSPLALLAVVLRPAWKSKICIFWGVGLMACGSSSHIVYEEHVARRSGRKI